MTKQEIEEMLEDNVYTLYASEKEYIDTKNGVLNENYLKRRKKIMIENAISYLADELIGTKQSYPVEDVSEVEMEIDAVVIKRKDLDTILRFIEEKV